MELFTACDGWFGDESIRGIKGVVINKEGDYLANMVSFDYLADGKIGQRKAHHIIRIFMGR